MYYAEFIICHYWYCLSINFRFQSEVWESCDDMMQKSMSFNDVAIATVGKNGYRIYFWGMTKLQPDLSEKS